MEPPVANLVDLDEPPGAQLADPAGVRPGTATNVDGGDDAIAARRLLEVVARSLVAPGKPRRRIRRGLGYLYSRQRAVSPRRGT